MAKRGRPRKTHPNISNISGGNIFQDIGKTIKNKFENFKDYSKKTISGRSDFPPKVRSILEKVGDQKIKSITIKRTPVAGVLLGTLSLFSLGKFGKRMQREYDELFHLFIELTLENNKKVTLEKNEVINMDMNPKSRPHTESESVNTPISDFTLNEMLNNTEKLMGKTKFFGYNLTNNNCQDFILSFFKANNIGTSEDFNFIKQDTKNLFNNLPILRKFANTLTDIGARADVALTGAGVEEIKNYGMMLNHLTSHITDEKEPIDPKDYEQSKIIIDAIKKEKANMKGGKIQVHHYHYMVHNKCSCEKEMKGGKIILDSDSESDSDSEIEETKIMTKPKKGSVEAKEKMRKIREMKKK